jgi:hypothetical protein
MDTNLGEAIWLALLEETIQSTNIDKYQEMELYLISPEKTQ